MTFSMRLVFIQGTIRETSCTYVFLQQIIDLVYDRAGLVYTERHQRRLEVVECDTVDYIASLFDDEENICITSVCH